MKRSASLPWYDLACTRNTIDEFWSVLYVAMRDHGLKQLPQTLDRHTPLASQWSNPSLLLSQCCGPDLFTPVAQQLETIARPVFDHLDCKPGNYFSYIVAAKHYDGGPARLLVNSLSSRSGYSALIEWTAAKSIESKSLSVSGSHQHSLAALRLGRADLAAIDVHSWNLLQVEGLSVIARSAEALAPPYVLHSHNLSDRVQLSKALEQAIALAGKQVGIKALISTEKQEYESSRILPCNLSAQSQRLHSSEPHIIQSY